MAKKVSAKKTEDIEQNEALYELQRREEADIAVEKRLIALYTLQRIDSEIDKIQIIRGELPLEVQDLEDEIAGLETRLANFDEEAKTLSQTIVEKENMIEECKKLIKKYETQQNNVRNNREFDSLSKEIEFQTLEIQLCERRIKEAKFLLEQKTQESERAKEQLKERSLDLEQKRKDLEEITTETSKEEEDLKTRSLEQEKLIEERYLTAYKKIRANAKNGLAVVPVERDACGGCFSKIPHQRQMEIRLHKKIIVCEYCGRILVDEKIVEAV